MRRLVRFALLASVLALFAAPASAQMTIPKGAGHQTAPMTPAMMSTCSAMMQEVMADPIVRARMMAIMQKHMKQRAGHGSMMMPGMPGANAMPGGNARSGSSSHEAHHTPGPVAPPTPSSSPMPAPSP